MFDRKAELLLKIYKMKRIVLIFKNKNDISTYSPILMKCENEESNTYYMDMDEFGVSDSNFADASEILCDEREELIIKLMEKMENENN